MSRIVPAHQITIYAKIHEISFELDDEGRKAFGSIVLDIRGILTEKMHFVAEAKVSEEDPVTPQEISWDVRRMNPAERFYVDARDSELHSRVIHMIRKKLNNELSARKLRERMKEFVERAA